MSKQPRLSLDLEPRGSRTTLNPGYNKKKSPLMAESDNLMIPIGGVYSILFLNMQD